MTRKPFPGELGFVGSGPVLFEAIHADWPAYPGDDSWELSLLRLGDFPRGTEFQCISIIDQCALFVTHVNKKEPDLFSDKHMHVAVRLKELLEMDEQGFVNGVVMETEMSPAQVHAKRSQGPELWAQLQAGGKLYYQLANGEYAPIELEDDEEWAEEDRAIAPMSPRSTELVGMYEGTLISLKPAAWPEMERLARETLEIPPSLQSRLGVVLDAGLYDSAIRDLGAALETRMRVVTGTSGYGQNLIEDYIKALHTNQDGLPARIKSLRQELRSIFKFIRNEFAHNLVELEPSHGYAFVSRLCWHVRDVELVIESRGQHKAGEGFIRG
ncbi:hypothetical protein SAMN04487917_103150 [Arthrobacter sp. yr096]|uniref:hypothetical protein n=1 Tax=Arthrobacter sp. yr096 TaxID=1761750 RepID=UPI0008BE7892|nr:hypothetical protein [Arthrobacter sp. yr096]SEI96446.1 hypothetical protein SAMN04487917_103150 [Arthrobacter sp. yr096]